MRGDPGSHFDQAANLAIFDGLIKSLPIPIYVGGQELSNRNLSLSHQAQHLVKSLGSIADMQDKEAGFFAQQPAHASGSSDLCEFLKSGLR